MKQVLIPNTHFFALLSGCALYGLLTLVCPAAGTVQPNIILIVADDMGYHDTGFNGLEDFTTPHLDRLARAGVICRNGYASHPYCAPTRAGLMTGRYQHRFGFEGNPGRDHPNDGLPADEETLADVLVAAGYDTAGLGKWHLGELEEHHPLRRGFRSYFGFLEGSRSYLKTDLHWWTLDKQNRIVETPPSESSRKTYLTDLLTDEAVQYIRGARDKPFFMYLAYNAPHGPMEATPEWLAEVPAIGDKKRRTYAAMVTALDDGIGRVRKAVEEAGLTKNTLVFFFSDNGGITPVNAASNRPFSGLKGTLLEGGIHVPYLVAWPGVIPGGTEYPHPVMTFDVFATAVSAAGGNPRSGVSRDSVNLLPFLTGKSPGPPHEILYWRTGLGFQLAALRGSYKYFHVDGLAPRLFDLTRDVAEAHPITNDGTLGNLARAWSASLPETGFTGHGLKLPEQWKSVGFDAEPDSRLGP